MAGADLSRINTNIAALNALKSLRDANSKLTVHQLRLATGKRINSAGDDPAGLVFAKRLESRARGLAVARDNVGDVNNLISTAEGGIQSISEILLTMKEKILQFDEKHPRMRCTSCEFHVHLMRARVALTSSRLMRNTRA